MKKIFILLLATLFITAAEKAYTMEADILGGVDIHGFISQGYMESSDNNYLASDSSDGTFAFNEIGINFSKQLTDQLHIGLQLFSHDLGQIGNNEVVLDWAFADYRWKDWLGLRAGKIKAPHGLYNETRDIDMLRTNIFLPQGVYTELNRDTMIAINGIGVYGIVPAGSVGSLSYYLLAGTMDVSGDDDNGAVRQANSSRIYEVSEDFDFEEVYIAALEWQTPINGLRLKWTYRTTDFTIHSEVTKEGEANTGGLLPEGTALTNAPADRHANYVYSIEYTWNDLLLAAEYQQVRSELIVDGPAFSFTQWLKNRGYYVSAAYRLNEWVEVGAYWSKYYDNSDDKNGKKGSSGPFARYTYDYQAWLEDYALSLRFDINEYWVAKIEGHLMNGAALCLDIDNDDYEEDWYMFAAKLSFSF